MAQPDTSSDDFTALARRAGLILTPTQIEELRAQIAPSWRALAEMTERVRARLTPQSEPPHLFTPNEPADRER